MEIKFHNNNVALMEQYIEQAMKGGINAIALTVTEASDTLNQTLLNAMNAGILIMGLNSGDTYLQSLGVTIFIGQNEYSYVNECLVFFETCFTKYINL